MEITSNVEDRFHVITIDGDVEASSSILLDEAIESAIRAGATGILIDCTSLDYINSSGIGVFTSRISEENQRIVLFGLSPKVRNVFEILGLDQLIPIVDSKAEAKAQITHGL